MMHHLSVITRYSLYALLIFTPLARASVQPWAITVIHIITLIALTCFLLEKAITWDWKWIKTPLDKPMMILLILCILSTLFSVHRQTSIWSFILLMNYLVIFYLVINTIRTRAQFRWLIYLIIGVGVFLSVFGMVKGAGINPFPWWDYSELRGSIGSSTYGNKNHLAGYLEMTIPLTLGLLLTGLNGLKRFVLICLSFLLLTGLLLTLSRGGMLGAFAGLSFMALALLFNQHFSGKKVIAALACCVLVTLLVFLSSTPAVQRIRTLDKLSEGENFDARSRVWGKTLKMIGDYPILGAGPGTYATVFVRYQPIGILAHFHMAHNDYLHFIAEVGLPLAVIMVWMIIALYRRGFKKLKNPSSLVRGITFGSLAGVAAILVHSFMDFNLHIPANALLFTVLAALVIAPLPIDNTSRSRWHHKNSN